MKLPRGCQIVKCKGLQFEGKTIAEIELLEDFLWLLSDTQWVFKLKNVYYYIVGEIVYLYKEGK